MGGIKLRKVWLAEYSTSGMGVEPEYAGITQEAVEEYLRTNPMPDDPNYSKQDLINDLCDSSGTLSFVLDISEAMVSFLQDILNELHK